MPFKDSTKTFFTKMRRSLRRVSCFVLVLAFTLPSTALAKDEKPVIHAGYRTLASSLPSERLMLHMGVWYPTLRRPSAVKVGNWSFRAARNAPVHTGPWPVIILSHDVTGDAWAHHTIAASLARRGFIVAAPTHDHDNGNDMRMLWADRELPLRAVQLRAALDVVLEHKQIGPQADARRVGYLGFGLTAPAGLLLAGASLTPEGWKSFVEKQKAKANGQQSPWLKPFVMERMDTLVDSMRHRAEERQEKTAMMHRANESRGKLFQRLEDATSRTHQRQMRLAKASDIPCPPAVLPLLPPLSHDRALADARFKALAMVSPGYSMLFNRQSLLDVRKPVFLAGAGKDGFNIPSEQAEALRDMLPLRPYYLLLPEADMASFHTPAPAPDAAKALGGIYKSETQNSASYSALLEALHHFFEHSLAQ